jgi:tRNA 2-thiouridine synthesizing protein A
MSDAVDLELDARGLNCPMPLVKARQAIAGLQAGQTLKVIATDRGSLKDFQGWAPGTSSWCGRKLLLRAQRAHLSTI